MSDTVNKTSTIFFMNELTHIVFVYIDKFNQT